MRDHGMVPAEEMEAWIATARELIEALSEEVFALRRERNELYAQLRFATEHANRETLAASALRAELDALKALEADEPADEPTGGDGVETTAVLPLRFGGRRSRRHEDDTLKTQIG